MNVFSVFGLPDGGYEELARLVPVFVHRPFAPRPGQMVSLIDDDGEPLRGRVFRRSGNVVSVQVVLPESVSRTA